MSTLKMLFFSSIVLFSTFCFAQTSTNAKLSDSISSLLNQAFYYVEIKEEEKKSLETIHEAERLIKNNPNLETPFFKAMTNSIRARALYNLGSFDECEKHIIEGLKNAKAANSKFIESYLYGLRGNWLVSSSNFVNAKKYHLKAIEAIEKEVIMDERITAIDFDLFKIDLYYSMADLEYRPFLNWRFDLDLLSKDELNKRLLSASVFAKKSVELINKTGKRKTRKKFMLIVLGQSYTELGKYKLSEIYLDSSKQLLKFGDNLNQFRLNYAYGNYYSKIGDISLAKTSYEKAYKFSRKYTDSNNKKFTNRLNNEIDYLTKGLKGDLLEAEIRLKKLEYFKNITMLLLVLLIILGLVIFSILQWRFSRIKSEINNDLIIKNEQLSRTIKDKTTLENKIQHIQHAIATDLHDNFGNRLAGIISTSEVLRDINGSKNKNKKKLDTFLINLDLSTHQLVLDLKDLIWSNNVTNNRVKEISFRFKNIARDLSKINNINIIFDDNFNDNFVLPQLWNRQLLLIYKEAINNACTYSNATQIKTGLEINDKGHLKLYIIDNGKGFEIDDIKKSGLFNMEKRVKSIDCNLIINSSKDTGTEIIIEGKVHVIEIPNLGNYTNLK